MVKDKGDHHQVKCKYLIFEGDHYTTTTTNDNLHHSSTSCGLLQRYSWPQRNYTCSFCKRHFSSAQALGGHMNVHRRDRARLRSQQLPPWFLQNPIPSPMPDLPSSSSNDHTPHNNKESSLSISFPSPLTISSPSCPKSKQARVDHLNIDEREELSRKNTKKKKKKKKKKGHVVDVGGMKKKGEAISLDLEIMRCKEAMQNDLDLELRLGYA